MLQQLLRRLVFDVPLLSEYCKMPLKVNTGHYVCMLLITLIKCYLLCNATVSPSSHVLELSYTQTRASFPSSFKLRSVTECECFSLYFPAVLHGDLKTKTDVRKCKI